MKKITEYQGFCEWESGFYLFTTIDMETSDSAQGTGTDYEHISQQLVTLPTLEDALAAVDGVMNGIGYVYEGMGNFFMRHPSLLRTQQIISNM